MTSPRKHSIPHGNEMDELSLSEDKISTSTLENTSIPTPHSALSENIIMSSTTTDNNTNNTNDIAENKVGPLDNTLTEDDIKSVQPLIELTNDTKKEQHHTYKHFIAIITLHTGKETHIHISLDLSCSVSSTIQKILQICHLKESQKKKKKSNNNTPTYPKSDWEYGLYIPQFKEDVRIPISELEHFQAQMDTQNTYDHDEREQGFWLTNDSTLESSLSLVECKSPVLFVKPRDTPREILVKVMPPIEMMLPSPTPMDMKQNTYDIDQASNTTIIEPAEYNDIELKVANIGVATMIFSSSKCTVEEAIKSICRTVVDYKYKYPNYHPHDMSNSNDSIADITTSSPSHSHSINPNDACLLWDGNKSPFPSHSLLFTNLHEQNSKNSKEPADMKLYFYFHEKDIPQDVTSSSSGTETPMGPSITGNTEQPLSTYEEEMVRAQLMKASEIIMQQPYLLTGEIILGRLCNVVFSCPPHPRTNGTLFITNFQVIFLSTDRSSYVSFFVFFLFFFFS